MNESLFTQEFGYVELLKFVKKHGTTRSNRTETKIISRFSPPLLEFDLSVGFPLLTTKKMFFRGIVEETLFFLRGETDTKKLEEKNVNIWKGNTSREFLDANGFKYLPEGSMGESYGWQWRHYNSRLFYDTHTDTSGYNRSDQIKCLIQNLKSDPYSRRHIVTAWNPIKIDKMVLPPCHLMFQMYVESDGSLSCKVEIRSNDLFLGTPFNIGNYAIITHIIAKTCGYLPGRLIISIGDAHIYENHIDAVNTQITRTPYDLPELNIKKDLNSIEDIEALCYDDFELNNYKHHPAIKAEMVV